MPSTIHLRLEWHPTRDLLGVCSVLRAEEDGGFASFFTKKGGKPFFTTSVRRGSVPASFCWHPFEPLLAIGWATGHLSIVNPTRKSESGAFDAELSEICCLLWDTNGTLLVAADSKGVVRSFKCHSEEETKLEHFGNARMKEERPRDICCKQMAKHLLKVPSTAFREIEQKVGDIKGEKNGREQQREETLAELLARHKRTKELVDIGEEEEREGQKPKAKKATGGESVSVFLIGTDQGGVYLLEPDSNQLSRIFQADSGIKQLVDMPERVHVLAITESMMFYQLAIEGKVANDSIKVKLGAQSKHFQILRVDAHTVAFCYGDREIRVWDLETEDSAILRLSAEKGYENSDEQVLMLSFAPKKDSICGVTSKGRLATWRRVRDPMAKGGPIRVDQQWKLAGAIALNTSNVIGMAWAHTSTAFAVNSGDSVQIFLSQSVDFYVDSEFAVLQVSAQLLTLVKITEPVETQELQLHSNIRGFFVTGNHLLLWDDAKIQLDQLHCPSDGPLQIAHIAAFDVQNVQQAAYHDQHVITIIGAQLSEHTLQGTVKRAITFREIEGRPEVISVKGNWLCAATSLGYLRIYDLTESTMKLVFHSSNLRNVMPNFGKWVSVKMNATGTRVSFTFHQESDERLCDRLFVWEAESDSVGYFSFHEGITDQQQYEADSAGVAGNGGGTASGQRPKTAALRKIESEQSRFRMPNHLPGNHFWDHIDPRLLICDANPVGAGPSAADPSASLWLTMFVTAEHGIQMHDLHKKPTKADSLLFVSVPNLYFLRNIEVEQEDDPQTEQCISRLILRKTMREFVGIDPRDEKAVRAMLDFAFFLCVGQMDNAFKAIKFIKSESVWEHMARMCVKTRRIDVARVCLGHMANARAARAIRRTAESGEGSEVQIAHLAVELGMVEEAVSLFQKADRWDEVNRLLQAQGKWPEAIQVAEKHDRIHLRHTHYNYGKYLESVGAIEKAIENYEKANVHHFEVPRMLCDEPKVLEFYVRKKAERELFKWWAQFLESQGDTATAKNYYRSADDFLSVVRIECQNGQVEEAAKIVDQSGGNCAAAFHLALHLESMGDFGGAVRYFSTAGAYSNAIRLAKEHNMVDRLVNLALMAGGAELVDAAEFYTELPGHADKVVMLYHKAGLIGRSLDFAFRTEQFGALDLIAQELNEHSDPSVLTRAAEFFSANQQDGQAVRLLVYAKKYFEAVKLCADKNVQITEELDNFLTPNKLETLSAGERSQLLEQIARCALQQGNYHFAAKKFTQAGNKMEAMRALLKSGDTQRVILFAQTARVGDIYRMAGNYLQSLDWKEDARLMRQIEAFYVRAGAMDLLSNFYESCAQVEIDEFHDYEKAAAAYGEAIRCLAKKAGEEDARGQRNLLERREKLDHTLDLITHFNQTKNLYETDPGEAIRQLSEMAERSGIDEHIRLGDIYALMAAHYYKRENYRKAWQLIEHCEQRLKPRVDLRRFLQRKILDRICDEMAMPRMASAEEDGAGGVQQQEEGTGVEYSHALRRRMKDDEGATPGDEGTGGGRVNVEGRI